jgi:hypothetical protein
MPGNFRRAAAFARSPAEIRTRPSSPAEIVTCVSHIKRLPPHVAVHAGGALDAQLLEPVSLRLILSLPLPLAIHHQLDARSCRD